MAIQGKILTRLEPTIELDKLGFKSYGESEGDNPGDNNTSQELGVEFPLIIINGYRFDQPDINAFEISLNGFAPTIDITIKDIKSTFTTDSFPRDGDVINVRIASKPKDTYKDIRMDFDIVDVFSPAKSPEKNNMGGAIYQISGRMKIPGLYAEQCKSYGLGTTLDHLENITTDLKLGLASNIDSTDDSMNLITPYEPIEDTITDLVKHSYINDDSFVTCCVDPYYYFNFIDLNSILNSDEDFEDVIASFDININDTLGPDVTNEKNLSPALPMVLTSLSKAKGTNLHISKYAMQNNAGKQVKKNGYKRILQFFENDSEETGLVNFDIEPLSSNNLKDIHEPLKGRRDEERYKQEVKYKYVGRRHSDSETSNTHLNYNFAGLHNVQNMEELDKVFLEIELSSWNPAIYRYQKVPVIIYSETSEKTTEDAALKAKKEELGFEANAAHDPEDKIADPVAIDEFLSGFYIVGEIKYVYKKKTEQITQQMKLLRREWPSRINNIPENISGPTPEPTPQPAPPPPPAPEPEPTPEPTPEPPPEPTPYLYELVISEIDNTITIIVYDADGAEVYRGEPRIRVHPMLDEGGVVNEAKAALDPSKQDPNIQNMRKK